MLRPNELHDLGMIVDASELELIRSALRYYHTGTPYIVGNDERRRMRADRAGLLASALDKLFPSTIDRTGDGSTVELLDSGNGT